MYQYGYIGDKSSTSPLKISFSLIKKNFLKRNEKVDVLFFGSVSFNRKMQDRDRSIFPLGLLIIWRRFHIGIILWRQKREIAHCISFLFQFNPLGYPFEVCFWGVGDVCPLGARKCYTPSSGQNWCRSQRQKRWNLHTLWHRTNPYPGWILPLSSY